MSHSLGSLWRVGGTGVTGVRRSAHKGGGIADAPAKSQPWRHGARAAVMARAADDHEPAEVRLVEVVLLRVRRLCGVLDPFE